MSDSKHHKNHPMKYPPISQSCDMCGTDFDLGYNDASGRNRSRFCSRECYFELIGSRRHAKKKWIILRILDQRGPLTSGELGKIMDKFDTKGNARVEEETDWITVSYSDEPCDAEIHNHYRGHVAEDAEQDAILVAFRVVPSNCEDEMVEIDIELFQNGYAANYSHWVEISGDDEYTDVSHTFDGVAVGNSWTLLLGLISQMAFIGF